jgi:acetolactate synthase-1/2/3 large subunit
VRLTGGEIVAEALARVGVPYVAGIPGHGCLGLVDAFRLRGARLPLIQVRHEQSAAHLADAYYRVTGTPLAVFTSIGPGAVNTAVGAATAFVDGSAMLLLTSDVHTYMAGRGVLQEIDRIGWGDFPRMLEPVVKQWWNVSRVDQLPRILTQAFRTMLDGRPGPVLIDLPMDVQSDAADVQQLPDAGTLAIVRPAPDPDATSRATRLLLTARRPVILAGGGVLAARAETELVALAEFVGAPIVSTMMAKGAVGEEHPLFGSFVGANGTRIGNALASDADLILAVGVRFADKATSSYRAGASLNIPPAKLIHVDVHSTEIGRNYPVEVGIVADARSALRALLEAVRAEGKPADWRHSSLPQRLTGLRREWDAALGALGDNADPPTISHVLRALRAALPDDAIVVTSSGHTQAQVFLEFPVRQPRTYLTAGGFSTMGWSLPAALGAQLAQPGRVVCAVVGDGDFLQTIQELATAVQYDLPILVVVCNNQGWQSITDLQISAFGRDSDYATRFLSKTGEPVSPRLAEVAQAFGAMGVRVDRVEQLPAALRRVVSSRRPAVLEVMVERAYPRSAGVSDGCWDVPVPEYFASLRQAYEAQFRDTNRVVSRAGGAPRGER